MKTYPSRSPWRAPSRGGALHDLADLVREREIDEQFERAARIQRQTRLLFNGALLVTCSANVVLWTLIILR